LPAWTIVSKMICIPRKNALTLT